MSETILSFRRCQHVDPANIECENTFPIMGESVQKFCDLHKDIINADHAVMDEEIKNDFLQLRKEHELTCEAIYAHEGLDGLEKHIAQIEKLIEDNKTKWWSARAVRQSKLMDLSDEERAIRRKIKVQTPEKKLEKTKAIDPKTNPIGHFMKTFGWTREQAENYARSMGVKI